MTNKGMPAGRQGFTIVELVISIFILASAIIGIYAVFAQALGLAGQMPEHIKANYLAQEGLEIIKNMRDTNWLSLQDWNFGLTDCEDGCEADYKTGTDAQESPLTFYGTGQFLNVNQQGFYDYSVEGGGSDDYSEQTKFKRKITITFPETDVMKVVSQVFWYDKGAQKSAEAEVYLYNWR